MVDMPAWNGIVAHVTSTAGDARVNRGAAITGSEATDLASTAVAESIRLSGADPNLQRAMLGRMTQNWEHPAGSGTVPASTVARPILDRINRTTDRATLERIRDGVATMRNDLERHRPNPENWAHSTPQLARIQDFTQTIVDAANRRLAALGHQADGVQLGQSGAAPRAPGGPAALAGLAPARGRGVLT